jgi:hypothetical protein
MSEDWARRAYEQHLARKARTLEPKPLGGTPGPSGSPGRPGLPKDYEKVVGIVEEANRPISVHGIRTARGTRRYVAAALDEAVRRNRLVRIGTGESALTRRYAPVDYIKNGLVLYVGGPLHGKTAPDYSARYRDEVGIPVTTRKGWRQRRNTNRLYTMATDSDGRIYYVHSSHTDRPGYNPEEVELVRLMTQTPRPKEPRKPQPRKDQP